VAISTVPDDEVPPSRLDNISEEEALANADDVFGPGWDEVAVLDDSNEAL
jgi:hypothetical protein